MTPPMHVSFDVFCLRLHFVRFRTQIMLTGLFCVGQTIWWTDCLSEPLVAAWHPTGSRQTNTPPAIAVDCRCVFLPLTIRLFSLVCSCCYQCFRCCCCYIWQLLQLLRIVVFVVFCICWCFMLCAGAWLVLLVSSVLQQRIYVCLSLNIYMYACVNVCGCSVKWRLTRTHAQ